MSDNGTTKPGDQPPTTASEPRRDRLAPVKRLASGGRGMWAGLAVLCVVLGVVASVLAARTVAHSNVTSARQAFPRSSAAIASTLKLEIQHEEDLAIGASTLFAGNPTASAREFDAWVKWAQTLRRYPELQRLGFVTLVRAPELAAFQARITGRPVTPPASLLASRPTLASRSAFGSRSGLGSRSTPASPLRPASSGGFPIVPAGTRSYYCLASVELARSPQGHPPAGLDYCAVTPGLLASRNSTSSVFAPASVGRTQGLAILAPVYRGAAPPPSFAGRSGAFVGWLREVLLPGVVLEQALRGNPQYAVRLRGKAGSSSVLAASGTPRTGAQSTAVSLHGGWTARIFGPPAPSADVLNDGDALALLIAGCLLSVVLGLLVFVLGNGGRRAPARQKPKLPHEELYDRLTGLPNRALMLDRAERMLARAGRQSGLLVGALFIDIDWFKDVNEKLGRTAGDQLLKIVTERLQSVVRTHDTVGRLGGDEFVVLVESAARGVRFDSVARRVIEALHKPLELDGFGPSFALTASIGIAYGRYATAEDLLRDAKLALHAAQAAGRDRYTLFNANMRSVIEGRGVLEVELNTALQEKQFFLLYQPIYDLATQRVACVEALIRWQHPTQGVLLPEDFIPLSEETGLIVPMGRWALEEACGRAAAWNVDGHSVGVSLKVSTNQLNRDGFTTDVRRALQQSGIEPSLLTLEVAEATVMRDVAAAAGRLQELKQLGVRVAIDDFGSGYAHHADLKQLPLDALKVDRGSLATTDDEDYRSWLLQAILIVGQDLSVPVIATGIETHEQLTALRTMGCAMAQGTFMGAPTATDAVEGLFDADFPGVPATGPQEPA